MQRTCPPACISSSPSELSADAPSRLAIDIAKAAYEARSKEKEIIVHLPTAIAIINHLRKSRDIDIHHFVLASPYYGRDTIAHGRYYKVAAKSADAYILGGMADSLETMLKFLPEQSRVVSVMELEKLLMTLARWDCAAWKKKWIWVRMKMMTMKTLYREVNMNEGARVLVERAEESVRDVVGALI